MNRRLFALAGLALCGCAAVPSVLTTSDEASLLELEPVFALTGGRRGIILRTASTGCTNKADWAFFVERRGDGGAAIAFARRRLDPCRSPPGEVELVFSWAELGLKPGGRLTLLNPLRPSR
jgi:hypothetical protein